MLLFCRCRTTASPPIQVHPTILPYLLTVEHKMTHAPSIENLVDDLDGDGTSESITVHNFNDLEHQAPPFITPSDMFKERNLPQFNFPYARSINVFTFDIDQDGRKEIFIDEIKHDSLYLHILDHKSERLAGPYFLVTGKPREGYTWECHAKAIAVQRHDEKLFIILSLHTSYSYQPRGLLAMEYPGGRTLPIHSVGAQLNELQAADLDGDGALEYFSGSATPDNGDGEPVNGTDDRHAYFLVFDAMGEQIHKFVLSHHFGRSAAYLLPDSSHQVAHFLILYSGQTDSSYIGIYEYPNGQWKRKETLAGQIATQTIIKDFDHDGDSEFLLVHMDGTVELRNKDFTRLKVQTTGLRNVQFLSHDLDQDGREELCLYSNFFVNIYSDTWKLLARCDIDIEALQIIHIDRKPRLFASSKTAGAILAFNPNLALAENNMRQLVRGLGIGGLLVLLVFFGIKWYKQQQIPYLAQHALQNMELSGVLILDRSGLVQQINEKAKRLLSIADFQQGLHYTSTLKDQAPPVLSLVAESLSPHGATGQSRRSPVTVDVTPNLQITARPLLASGEQLKGVLLLLEDRREQIQAMRAIAWSTMAQRLAHQIKTPLSSVLLAVQRLQMEYAKEAVDSTRAYDRYIDYVTGEVGRIRQAIDGFLKLARLEKPVWRMCNLNDLILLALHKIESHVRANIKIDKALTDPLPLLAMDDNQMLIAFAIVLENGVEAMPHGGLLNITTGLAHDLQKNSRKNGGNSLRVVVSDTGVGIAASELEKVFEPFYTTKPNGTGLGLSIAKKIIEDHGGSISLTSSPGLGTQVTIRLPLDQLS